MPFAVRPQTLSALSEFKYERTSNTEELGEWKSAAREFGVIAGTFNHLGMLCGVWRGGTFNEKGYNLELAELLCSIQPYCHRTRVSRQLPSLQDGSLWRGRPERKWARQLS